jgi:hypothetical protein
LQGKLKTGVTAARRGGYNGVSALSAYNVIGKVIEIVD